MKKIKRVLSLGLTFLLTLLLSLSAVGCAKKSMQGDSKLVASDEGGEYGLYTNLCLSLDGGDGQVRATVKNRLTVLPSTVTVKVELYRSQYYHESYKDMTLVAEEYIADLNHCKSITVTCPTNGDTLYWKARMYFNIDGRGWKERVTNTILLNQNGIVTNEIIEEKDYFISDFLRSDAEKVCLDIPYLFGPYGNKDFSYSIWERAHQHLETEEQMENIIDMFGEIKLNPFVLETKTDKEIIMFYLDSRTDFDMRLDFSDDSYTKIYIINRRQDLLDANLFVQYNYFTESGNKIHRCFTATVPEETADALCEFTKNIYES